jgi:hypothetical protein
MAELARDVRGRSPATGSASVAYSLQRPEKGHELGFLLLAES